MILQYDIVIDCTDSPSTRYLISDAAVICGKPLVSGSALGTEGQLAVYGYRGGPCYRCVFPTPPPPDSVVTCGEGGILGPGTVFKAMTTHFIVVGVIGVMQALEAIKMIIGDVDTNTEIPNDPYYPTMTLFSAFDSPQWRSFRLRSKRENCASCGRLPSITAETLARQDYSALCLRTVPEEISSRVSVQVSFLFLVALIEGILED